MRPTLLLLPALLAIGCSRGDKAPAAEPAAAPAGLTEADAAGTWTGTASIEPSDSVAFHWTQVCAGGSCTGTSQEMPDTVRSTYRLVADSSIGVSQPFTQNGARVIEHYVAQITGNTISGRAWYVLADKLDSVVVRLKFTGTRQQ